MGPPGKTTYWEGAKTGTQVDDFDLDSGVPGAARELAGRRPYDCEWVELHPGLDAWLSERAEVGGSKWPGAIHVETENGKWGPVSYHPGLMLVIFRGTGEVFRVRMAVGSRGRFPRIPNAPEGQNSWSELGWGRPWRGSLEARRSSVRAV